MPRRKPPPDPFRWFDSSPEVIQLVVMMYVKYPLSLRNVEDLLHERGIDICHETVVERSRHRRNHKPSLWPQPQGCGVAQAFSQCHSFHRDRDRGRGRTR